MVGTYIKHRIRAFINSALKNEDGFLSLFSKEGRGLCFGGSTIKVCSVKQSGTSWKLTDFAQIAIPDGSISNREIIENVGVSQSLLKLAQDRGLKRKDVCMGLAGPSLLIKSISVDVEDEKEIEAQVFWEAENYLPFDPTEVSMDCFVLPKGAQAKREAIFVAVKLSYMESYQKLLNEVNVKNKIVDSELIALANLIEANYTHSPQEAIAVFDLGGASLKGAILHNFAPIYTKETNYGGRNLTAEIQRNLGHSFEEAEKLKLEAGFTPTPQDVMELIQLSSENYCIEMKRMLDFYHSSSSGPPVTLVLLTGGSAQIPNLTALAEERLGVPTNLLNPFLKVQVDTSRFKPEQIQKMVPIVAVPLGLAMRAASS